MLHNSVLAISFYAFPSLIRAIQRQACHIPMLLLFFFQIIVPAHHHMTLHPEILVLDKRGNPTFENLFTDCQNKMKSYSQRSRLMTLAEWKLIMYQFKPT